MDVVLVTTDDTGGLSARDYANDFYDEGGFGTGKDASGVLYLLDMDNRELYLSTSGVMIRFLTDDRIESMLDHAIDKMASGAYAAAAEQLLEDTESWYRKGIPGGQYNYDVKTGAVCAGGVCLNVKREYAMKQEHRQASNYALAYRANAHFALQDPQDVMVHSFVTQKIIPKATVRVSPGGGFSGSSGRSSTHRSGSGRSHGGGGRRF